MSDRDRAWAIRLSKTLAYLLRHHPEEFGVRLDPEGWAAAEAVLAGLRVRGFELELADLAAIAARGPKRRFEFDGARIRAVHGHSVEVRPSGACAPPPARLFHGTATTHLASIRELGLVSGSRRFVHLDRDPRAARAVGARHGAPVLLAVDAARMHAAGHPFWPTTSGVWLTPHVPTDFLTALASDGGEATGMIDARRG